MKTKFFFIITLLIVLFPIKSECGFFKSVWNKVSSVPGKVGNLFAKGSGLGGVVEGSFEPAINRYEEANRRSINLLDEKLNTKLNQFNDILKAREDQLDEIFKSSIYLMDESLKDNINKIDESLKTRIGQLNSGLSNASFSFSSSLWTVFRGIAAIVLVFALIFIIEKFISQFQINKKNQKKEENKKLTRQLYFRAGVILLGFLFIIFFQPSIFKRFQDPSLKEQINAISGSMELSAETLNYDESIYYASLLTNYEIQNPVYQYYLLKYTILRDFVYRPKLALFSINNIQTLQAKFTLLEQYKEEAFKKNKFEDPEFEILNALFFSNIFNNKEGDLIAAFLSNKALNLMAEKEYSLKALGISLINNYSFHQLPDDSAINILVKYELSSTTEKVPDFTKYESFSCNPLSGSILCTNLNYNSVIADLHKEDEKGFVEFLKQLKNKNKNSIEEIGKKFIERWNNSINKIDDIEKISSNVTAKSLNINDGYINYVIKKLREEGISTSNLLNDITDKTKNIASTLFPDKNSTASSNSNIDFDAARKSFDALPIYKQYIVAKFLNKFSFQSRIPILTSAVNSFTKMNENTDSLVKYYFNYLEVKQTSSSTNKKEDVNTYCNLIQNLSNTDLYNYDSEKPSPFTLTIFEELNKDYSVFIERDEELKALFETTKNIVNNKLLDKRQIFL